MTGREFADTSRAERLAEYRQRLAKVVAERRRNYRTEARRLGKAIVALEAEASESDGGEA